MRMPSELFISILDDLKRYVAGIDKVTRVKYISESQSIWTTLFIHPPPMSPRVYTVYQVSWLQEFSYRRRG